MLNPRLVNIYGYVFLAIVLIMIVLVLLKLIPASMATPLFLVALVLYLIRITLRLLLERQKRLGARENSAEPESKEQ